MDAKQTPLVDLLRLHADDLHSVHGHNQSSHLLSRAADEVDRLKSNLAALEDEKNSYIDYVGDALGQDHDGETLWDAAQRVLSERDRLRAENERLRKNQRCAALEGEESDDVQLDAAKSTAAIAWGWLWHVTTADDRVKTARHILGQMLDNDLKRYGIQTAKDEGAQVNVHEIEAAMLRGEFGKD